MNKLIMTMGLVVATLTVVAGDCLSTWPDEQKSSTGGDVAVYPNVFIVFDTSGSMAEVPYRTKDGKAVLVGTRRWKEDVKIGTDGKPHYDDAGELQWTDKTERVNNPNADAYLTDGSHPASKLYQAKLALNTVLSGIDGVNLGFATFLQERIPRVKALYYRIINNNYYEFSWFVTHGDWTESDPDQGGYINPVTLQVTPFGTFPEGSVPYPEPPLPGPMTLPDPIESPLSPTPPLMGTPNAPPLPPFPSSQQVQQPLETPQAVLPSRPELPRLPFSDSGGLWYLVREPLKKVSLADGTIVNAYPCGFDYSAIRYPLDRLTSPTKPPCWSYVRVLPEDDKLPSEKTKGVLGVELAGGNLSDSNRVWPDSARRDPYFPLDADVARDNYLGLESLSRDGEKIPELSNYAGDDHLVFVHLPDPNSDDNPDRTDKKREEIRRVLSLNRVTDPVFACKVTGGEFCPNGTDGLPYHQYTTMPYTSSLACGGLTPLGATLHNVKDYYLSYFDQDTQSRYRCRENYVIIFTDGWDTCLRDPIKAAQDLLNLTWHEGRDDARVIPVKTFVVGFGLDEESKELLNTIADAGGTDRAYFPQNLPELTKAFREILENITAGMYTRSDPVVDFDGERMCIYTGYHQLPGWDGHLKKYLLDEGWTQLRYQDEGYVADPAWYPAEAADEKRGDAGAQLSGRSDAERKVYTANANRERIAFTESMVEGTGGLEEAGLKSTGFTDSGELISFVRNVNYVHYDDEAFDGWKLGDIYHSTPVVVRDPLRKELRENGNGKWLKRTSVVIVGANDGMLHAFDDSSGKELWAYIPRCLLGKLYKLDSGHQFLVDLSAKAADVSLSGTWRTVVLGGLRQGGPHYFALDITDTEDPLPLWEVTHAELGETWAAPSFGRIPEDGYVAFVCGGYSPENDVGNSILVLDMESGAITHAFTNVGDNDEDFPAQARAVDLDKDGYIERVYFVSTKGRLYRLHIDLNEGIGAHSLNRIFDPGGYRYHETEKTTGNDNEVGVTRIIPEGTVLPTDITTMRRPVFHAPAVVRNRYMPNSYLIYYGTGDERALLDDTTQDFFFEVEDGGPEKTGKVEPRCSLVYVLEKGEKCLSSPETLDYVAYFTTFSPADVCGSGVGYIHGISMSSRFGPGGDAALKYDLDGTTFESEQYRVGGLGRIEGIPSSPQVVNGAIFFNSSESPDPKILRITKIPTMIRSWQEIY